MTARGAFLVALLLYVTLDLSLPSMPGAFVFEASDSVEGLQSIRVRQAAEPVMAPTAPGELTSAVTAHTVLGRRFAPRRVPRRRRRLRDDRPARRLTSSPGPSEDSH